MAFAIPHVLKDILLISLLECAKDVHMTAILARECTFARVAARKEISGSWIM